MNTDTALPQEIELQEIEKEQAIQILSADSDSNTFILNKEALHKVVERIPQDIPVSVVSVVGAFRSGKSFLLDFFLRYLRASASGEIHGLTKIGEIPSWMNYGGRILEGSLSAKDEEEFYDGFTYKGGSERNTEGIWLWSEPFIIPSDSVEGGKLCVLLMDTQGMFDGLTGQMLTTSIFGMSTLLSSYQIYNVEKRLQEDHLQNLALFSEYSRAVFNGDTSSQVLQRLSPQHFESPYDSPMRQSPVPSFLEAIDRQDEELRQRKRDAPFQQLDFLVRDWQNFANEESVEVCLKEMEEYKAQLFAPRKAEDLKETRDQINICYQNLDVFCLPHPGVKVTRMNYSGDLNDVEPTFLSLLGLYIEHIFSSRLQAKVINHALLYASDFEEYAIAYGDLFSEATLFPKALTILGATAKVNSNSAMRAALALYKALMDVKVNDESGFMRDEAFDQVHQKSLMDALDLFDQRATIGSKEIIEEHRQMLVKGIDEACAIYKEQNRNRDPLAFIASYIVPAVIIVIAFSFRLFLSTLCTSWSSTCKTTEEFFSSLIAFIIISIVLSNWRNVGYLISFIKGILSTLNKGQSNSAE